MKLIKTLSKHKSRVQSILLAIHGTRPDPDVHRHPERLDRAGFHRIGRHRPRQYYSLTDQITTDLSPNWFIADSSLPGKMVLSPG